MICKVIGDLTEKLVQHDNYDHYGARKQFYLHLAEQLQKWGHQSKLHVPWKNRTNLEAYQTYSVQVPATPKSTLMSQVTENITDVRVLSTGMAF